jgi:mono/diheme cytochrome c family protein
VPEGLSVRLRWSLGALAAAFVVALGVGAWMVLGGFDSTATKGYSQPTTWLIHRTMIDSVKSRAAAITPPPRFTQAEVLAGFRAYDGHCAMCHGGPGLGRQPWTAGMHPAPPYLLDLPAHWSPSDLYFIVSQGVKMTGMPAWSQTLSDGEIWDIVAFLEALPKLTASDYVRLRRAEALSSPPTQPLASAQPPR